MQIGDKVRLLPNAVVHHIIHNQIVDKLGIIAAPGVQKDWVVHFIKDDGTRTRGYEMWEHNLDRLSTMDDHTYCPVCGVSPIDYCQGHGEIGDPVGYAILQKHENGDHSSCYARMQCENG